jgi:putative transcriptional regulator
MSPTQRKPAARKRPAPARQATPIKQARRLKQAKPIKQSPLGKRLLQAAAEARAIAHGATAAPRVYVPPDVDVKSVRTRLGMTQQAFADTFGFPFPLLRDWEQGKARPDASTRAYLTVIALPKQTTA